MSGARELLEGIYSDWSRGDFKSPARLFDEEIEWQQAPEAVEPGTRRGQDEVRVMTRKVFEGFRDFRVEPVKFAELGERVLVVARVRGRSRTTDLELDRLTAQVWTFADGRAVKVEWYPDEAAARAQSAAEQHNEGR